MDNASAEGWPAGLPVAQVRIARPTDRLDKVARFYHDGLGLPIIVSFRGHAGYDGVMLGLPGTAYHLEFRRHEQGSPGRAPRGARIPTRATRESLLARTWGHRRGPRRLAGRADEYSRPLSVPGGRSGGAACIRGEESC